MHLTRIVIGCILLASCVAGCDTSKPFRSMHGMVWNTTYNITYASNVTLDDSVQAIMRKVEMSLSAFNDSSLISRVNRGDTIIADSMLRRVFLESQHINRLSGGVFDPTVGPLIELWGFGRDRDHEPPTQAMIDSVMTSVGIDSCSIDSIGHIIRKSSATRFNFSAIAKGYGCDMVGAMLRRNGVDNYMVEIGGEIAVAGHNPRGASWRVMIDAPVNASDTVIHERMAVIEIDSCGLATSGNYRNYRMIDGNPMGHTINPFTGHPAMSEILSVTVIAPECMTADALATACMLMPLDSATAMIEGIPGAAALMVTASADGVWEMHPTSRFPELSR